MYQAQTINCGRSNSRGLFTFTCICSNLIQSKCFPIPSLFSVEREYLIQITYSPGNDASTIDNRPVGKDLDEEMSPHYQYIHISPRWYEYALGTMSWSSIIVRTLFPNNPSKFPYSTSNRAMYYSFYSYVNLIRVLHAKI